MSLFKTFRSFRYAFKGIYQVFRNENNAKVHTLATVSVIAAGAILHIKTTEWLWLVLSIGLVWSAEAFNTAIEKLTDKVSPEWNEEAGQIKDISAGAVLIVSIFAMIAGLLVFLPYFL